MAYLSMLRELKPAAWRRRMRTLRSRLPVACLLCRERTAGALCALCREAVCASMLVGPRCSRCDLSGVTVEDCPDCLAVPPVFAGALAAFDYEWPGDLLIHQLKRQNRYYCAPAMAGLMAERWVAGRWMTGRCGKDTDRATLDKDACGGSAVGTPYAQKLTVVAVPSGRRALIQRGFNPAAELGRELAGVLGFEWQPQLLQRVHEGDQQKNLSREARRGSAAGLYACSEAVDGLDILVVDDVMTTGSTLNAVASVLKEQGARKVWAVVAARTPLRVK